DIQADEAVDATAVPGAPGFPHRAHQTERRRELRARPAEREDQTTRAYRLEGRDIERPGIRRCQAQGCEVSSGVSSHEGRRYVGPVGERHGDVLFALDRMLGGDDDPVAP